MSLVPTDEDKALAAGWREGFLFAEASAPRWQPIETAPAEGLVLVVGHQGNIPEVWSAKQVAICRAMVGDLAGYPVREAKKLTHWMPLPAPPAPDGGRGLREDKTR
jgi:hypothetical protein